MARQPYSTPTRRIPVPAAGTSVRLSVPSLISQGRMDFWTGLVVQVAAPQVVGDTTFSITEATGLIENGCEAAVLTTPDRLNGLHFKHNGAVYRITDHASAAGTTTITFVREGATTGGLRYALAADSLIKIQSDLPPLIAYLIIQCIGGDLRWCMNVDTIAASSSQYFSLGTGMSQVIYDSDDSLQGIKTDPIFLQGATGALTVEIQVATA